MSSARGVPSEGGATRLFLFCFRGDALGFIWDVLMFLVDGDGKKHRRQ